MDATSLAVPVALFVFNRPETTARVFERIAAARPQRLLLIADGPRADRPDEREQCRAARAIVQDVRWPCDVKTHFSDENLGCKRRIASGLDWVFSNVSEAIVLEDDCLPDPTFFRFCEEMLARYRDDPRIHMVRGTNFVGDRAVDDASYYFSRFYNIWGWATWSRAWAGYDVAMTRWPALRDTGWLERRLPDPAMSGLVRQFFDETHAGRVDTWDYQWVLAGWLHDRLSIVPARNLVSNIGYGQGATHTHQRAHRLAELSTQPLAFPLRHPAAVTASAQADLREWEAVYPRRRPRSGLWPRLRERLLGRRSPR